MADRRVPEQVIAEIVGNADEIIHRDDGRVDDVGMWAGGPIRVVGVGDIEEDDVILVVNIITNRRNRR